MRDHELIASPACTFNGWIEQLSVQATDFSILAISIATFLVVRQKARLTQVPTSKTILICASTWFIPLITSTTATAMGEMKPVSGNWCWISKSRTDLRYGLTHGWRFAIILITIGIYTHVWWYVSQHFKSIGALYGSGRSSRLPSLSFSSQNRTMRQEKEEGEEEEGMQHRLEPVPPAIRVDIDHQFRVKESDVESQTSNANLMYDDNIETFDPSAEELIMPVQAVAKPSHLGYHASVSTEPPSDPKKSVYKANRDSLPHASAGTYLRNRSKQAERDVKRMLLMNGYPIMYVILWIPGLTNRVLEASGKTNSSRVLAILQCSTQFIGFANSVTYGLTGIWRAGR